MSGGPGTGGSTSSSSSSTSSSASSSSSSYAHLRPEEGPKEKQEAPEAEYLSSRCVLFTYYQGDISSVVDEHFSRALSSYMDGDGKRRASEQPGTGIQRCPSVSDHTQGFGKKKTKNGRKRNFRKKTTTALYLHGFTVSVLFMCAQVLGLSGAVLGPHRVCGQFRRAQQRIRQVKRSGDGT